MQIKNLNQYPGLTLIVLLLCTGFVVGTDLMEGIESAKRIWFISVTGIIFIWLALYLNKGDAIAFNKLGANSAAGLTIEVRINANVLPGDATQEYKAAIILHEIVHGYHQFMNIDRNNQMAQHSTIATGYINAISSTLQKVYNIDPAIANSLAFGGIKDFADAHTTQYNQLLTDYGLTESPRNTNTEFQRGGF